jgi:hypothetical protein
VLRRVLAQIPSSGFFAVFTGITDVPILRYTSDNDRTTRPDPHSSELYTPNYEISTFDLAVPSCQPKTWEELLSARRLFSYGTPFFRIYFDDAEDSEKSISTDVIVEKLRLIAIDKLLDLPRLSRDLSQAQIFALLGCTIQQPRRYNYYLNPT